MKIPSLWEFLWKKWTNNREKREIFNIYQLFLCKILTIKWKYLKMPQYALVNHICFKKCVNSATWKYPALLRHIVAFWKKHHGIMGSKSCRDNQATYIQAICSRFFFFSHSNKPTTVHAVFSSSYLKQTISLLQW